MIEMDWAAHERLLRAVAGGEELISWNKGVPYFHDAEIAELSLSARGTTRLTVLHWRDYERSLSTAEPVLVTFDLVEIADLELDGFDPQNVIHNLLLQPAAARPDRAPYRTRGRAADIDVVLEPTIGLSGFIRCARVSKVSFAALR